MLVEEFTTRLGRLQEVIDVMARYARAGRRDWVSWQRLLDSLGREGLALLRYAGGVPHTDRPTRAAKAAQGAAGEAPRRGGR